MRRDIYALYYFIYLIIIKVRGMCYPQGAAQVYVPIIGQDVKTTHHRSLHNLQANPLCLIFNWEY